MRGDVRRRHCEERQDARRDGLGSVVRRVHVLVRQDDPSQVGQRPLQPASISKIHAPSPTPLQRRWRDTIFSHPYNAFVSAAIGIWWRCFCISTKSTNNSTPENEEPAVYRQTQPCSKAISGFRSVFVVPDTLRREGEVFSTLSLSGLGIVDKLAEVTFAEMRRSGRAHNNENAGKRR